jgi:hypothetical protein
MERMPIDRLPADRGVMNVFNFICILVALAIVFFLTAHPLNTIASSPLCSGYIFGYLLCP